MKTKRLIIAISFLPYLLLPATALAQQTLQDSRQQLLQYDYSLGANHTDPANPTDVGLWNVVDDIIGRLPFYLTGLAFLAFLYSGGMYIFAFGDANRQETAKKNMLWTVIGMVILVSIGMIIRFAHFLGTSTQQLPNMQNIPGITS